jgi:WD40 repeat protein
MAQTISPPASSLVDNVAPFEAGAHVVGACFLGGVATLALADGTILLRDAQGGDRRVAAHGNGAILAVAGAGKRIVTGGDDGRVIATDAQGATVEVATAKGWIDALAARSDGALAWSSGRTAFASDGKGEAKSFAAPSTVRGLAFMPKGYRLAVAHYNGVSLWFPNMAAAPDTLAWKGSHLDVTASPDGKFVVTSMQENALHGWRLQDKRDMRMSGYPAKTRSFSWSADGHWLATSGADGCIVWPFMTKDGPMGRAPKELGIRNRRVTCVSFHPGALVVAIGYADGFIILCRLDDGAEILVRANAGAEDGAVSALAWDGRGTRLLFGTESGSAGLVTLPD